MGLLVASVAVRLGSLVVVHPAVLAGNLRAALAAGRLGVVVVDHPAACTMLLDCACFAALVSRSPVQTAGQGVGLEEVEGDQNYRQSSLLPRSRSCPLRAVHEPRRIQILH